MSKNYRAQLTGVLGDPVDGNPTGVMEEAAFAACGLNWRYVVLKVKEGDLEAAFNGIKALNFSGCGVTMPHKIAILPLLDELTPAAKIIGAVNTLLNKDGKWIGENTDGKGFLYALKKAGGSVAGKQITILGAGGVARAIAAECALDGAKKFYIINRSCETLGPELAALITEKTGVEAEYLPWTPAIDIPAGTDVLVNATSIGLHPNGDQKPDINYDTINENMSVCDVIFNPADPLFLQEARKHGVKLTVPGFGMLVEQGALAFTYWTGCEAPTQVMYDTLAREFQED